MRAGVRRMFIGNSFGVIPAKAGIHASPESGAQWVPAFAGTTIERPQG